MYRIHCDQKWFKKLACSNTVSKTINCRSAGWWYSVLKLAAVVVAYFSASVALTFYQKDLIVALPFPLVMVTCHLVIKFVLAAACRTLLACICPKSASTSTNTVGQRYTHASCFLLKTIL